MLGYLRGIATETGLTARTARHDRACQIGESVSDGVMATRNLTRHDVCPTWNHTLRPRTLAGPDSALDSPRRPPQRLSGPFSLP